MSAEDADAMAETEAEAEASSDKSKSTSSEDGETVDKNNYPNLHSLVGKI